MTDNWTHLDGTPARAPADIIQITDLYFKCQPWIINDVLEWLKEEYPCNNAVFYEEKEPEYIASMILKFYKEEDAAAFKLRWIQKRKNR